MKLTRRNFALLALAGGIAACGRRSKFIHYTGQAITRIDVYKGDRRMYLYSGDKVMREYAIGLGQNPAGPKQFEGDMRTPEGTYYIDRVNPNSMYHLSLGISYPNAQDIANARAAGKRAGGEIFIHGQAGKNKNGLRDWTAGCIAVTDREVEEIYSMIEIGTPINIYP